jgi:UDP-N-acetyl-D-mannosaminuronic acid dehydrogenase
LKSISVFGLGFVGLPLSLTYTFYGVKVYGVDVNKEYIERLKKFDTHILEDYHRKNIKEILKESIENKLFEPTDSAELAMKNTSEIIVTVGVPVENRKAIMKPFNAAMETIGKNLKRGDLILIRSTVPPGTTREVALPILEKKSELKCGKDFFLAYSSERIAEGRAFEEFQTMPVAVAGINEESTKRGKTLLDLINPNVIKASSPEIVEISKLIENSSRDVNIALVNELASLTEKMGVDTMEVISVANTHKRVKLLTPGIGVGGHCIPYSSHYISYEAQKLGLELPLLSTAREVNENRPLQIVNYLEEALSKIRKSLQGTKFAITGIAMKDNSSDISESPAMRIKDIIIQKGGNVVWYDPNVEGDFKEKKETIEETLKDSEVLIIPIKQELIKLNAGLLGSLMKEKSIIFDPKGLLDRKEIEKLGFVYISI